LKRQQASNIKKIRVEAIHRMDLLGWIEIGARLTSHDDRADNDLEIL
jgi:hypothetical protein